MVGKKDAFLSSFFRKKSPKRKKNLLLLLLLSCVSNVFLLRLSVCFSSSRFRASFTKKKKFRRRLFAESKCLSERTRVVVVVVMARETGPLPSTGAEEERKTTTTTTRPAARSLRESLRDVDARLRSKLESVSEKVLSAQKTSTFRAPASLTAAIGDAQEKQQLEGEEKSKIKNKQDYLQDEMQPWVKPVGSSLADPEQGPFIAWCEEHFREVTEEDARKLIPSTSQPGLDEDPDFTLPEKERSYYEGMILLSLVLRSVFQILLFFSTNAGALTRMQLECTSSPFASIYSITN